MKQFLQDAYPPPKTIFWKYWLDWEIKIQLGLLVTDFIVVLLWSLARPEGFIDFFSIFGVSFVVVIVQVVIFFLHTLIMGIWMANSAGRNDGGYRYCLGPFGIIGLFLTVICFGWPFDLMGALTYLALVDSFLIGWIFPLLGIQVSSMW